MEYRSATVQLWARTAPRARARARSRPIESTTYCVVAVNDPYVALGRGARAAEN